MIECNTPGRSLRVVLFALVSGCSAGAVLAEDLVPPRAQSDEQISVWVNNATLDMFVSQLAGMTGRRAEIGDGVEGKISGRFNGSLVDTLNTLSEQHQILFDLDQSVLGVAPESAQTSTMIASSSVNDEVLQSSLNTDGLTGNEIEIRKDEIVVSGHPNFVKRFARLVTTAVADAGKDTEISQATSEGSATETLAGSAAAAVPAELETDSTADLASKQVTNEATNEAINKRQMVEQVTDATANVITEQAAEESLSGGGSDTATSAAPVFRWVTDIPGYDTF